MALGPIYICLRGELSNKFAATAAPSVYTEPSSYSPVSKGPAGLDILEKGI